MAKSKTALHFAKLVLLVPLVLYLAFIVPEKYGCWDLLKGLDHVQQIAERRVAQRKMPTNSVLKIEVPENVRTERIPVLIA